MKDQEQDAPFSNNCLHRLLLLIKEKVEPKRKNLTVISLADLAISKCRRNKKHELPDGMHCEEENITIWLLP
jgi:hypothetical protein